MAPATPAVLHFDEEAIDARLHGDGNQVIIQPDAASNQVRLESFHGTARVLADRVVLEGRDGDLLAVPDSALPNIRRSDGREPLLRDADHFVIVKVGSALPP